MYIPVEVVKDGDKEVFIKFKGIGELNCHLPDTVNKLQEYGCTLVITVVTVTMAKSLNKENTCTITLKNLHLCSNLCTYMYIYMYSVTFEHE